MPSIFHTFGMTHPDLSKTRSHWGGYPFDTIEGATVSTYAPLVQLDMFMQSFTIAVDLGLQNQTFFMGDL